MANDTINENVLLKQRIEHINERLVKLRDAMRKIVPEFDFATGNQLASIIMDLEMMHAKLNNVLNDSKRRK